MDEKINLSRILEGEYPNAGKHLERIFLYRQEAVKTILLKS